MRSLIGLALAGLLGAFGHPEQPVSTTRQVGELAAQRSYATATPYDGGFLVAWEDGRLGPASMVLGAQQATVYASRITAAGTLDPSGMRVSTAPFDQSDPVPGCIDVQCIVAWQQNTRGVWARAFNAATTVWGPETALSALTTGYVTPRLATVGNRFLVTWHAPPTGVLGRFVAVDGTPEASILTLVQAVSAGTAGSPQGWNLASNGTTFLVAWNDLASPHRVYAQVFTAAGVNVVAPLTLANSSSCDPVSAAVGSIYLVAWCDDTGRLLTVGVSDTGVAVNQVTTRLGATTGRSSVTAIAQGSEYVVGWVESAPRNELHGARLTQNFLVARADQVLRTEASPQTLLRFSAARDGQALAAWSVQASPWYRLRSSFLQVADGGLTMLDAGFVSQQRPDVHVGPRVARLGAGFVTAWNSVVDDGGVPMARVLDRLGQPVGPSVVLDPSALEVSGVDVSYDGTQTWAAWTTGGGVRVAQLDSSGRPSMVTFQAATARLLLPRLAHRGPQTLITWAWHNQSGAGTYGVTGQLLDAQGRLNAAASLTSGPSLPRYAVAASATQFGFAWATPPANQLYFSTIGADGGLTEPWVGPIATRADGIALASNGTDFLLTWGPISPGVVKATRITAAGTVLDAPTLTVSAPQLALNAKDLSLPDVSFDGTNYQVTWGEVVADGGALDVHRRSIASDGTLGPVEVVAGGPRYQHGPALTAGTVGRTLVAWVDSDEGGDEVMRVRARAFASLPPGESCVADAECIDGICLSGACCSPINGACVTFSDAGTDAGSDAGTDTGSDAGTDAGSDAGTDAGSDAGTEPGSDSGTDAGSDAGSDAGTDAGSDAGSDAGTDAGSDAGTDPGSDAGTEPDSDAGIPTARVYAVGCDCASTSTITFVGFALLGTLLRARSRRGRKA